MNKSYLNPEVVIYNRLQTLEHQISEIINKTAWSDFKDQSNLVPTIEVKALLLNAQQKVKKILIS